MADLNFPQNPQPGDTYSIGTRTWIWNGSGWALQSGIVSTNPFIVVSAQVTTSTNSTGTNSGALIVAGGGGFGGDIYANRIYANGAEVVTTGSIGSFGVSNIVAGTDTAVSLGLGNVALIWNTSTLATVTSRGATTPSAISITNNTTSSASNTGSFITKGGAGIGENLYVGGGTIGLDNVTSNNILFNTVGIGVPTVATRSPGTKIVLYPSLNTLTADYAIGIEAGVMWSSVAGNDGGQYFKWFGADVEVAKLSGTGVFSANSVYDDTKRVLTSVTPTAGTAISITAVSTSNANTTFTINNTGVTSLTGTAALGVSSSTGDITLTNFGVTTAVGSTYIGVSTSSGAVTFVNLGVQTLTAGTDTAVSASTGTVTVWNTANLQSVTDRGFTTSNRINITDATSSTSTTTGALTVAGGVGIRGNLHVGGEIIADKLTIQYTTVTTTMVETDDIIKTTNTTASTGTETGALIIAGGGGFGSNVWALQLRQTAGEVAIGSEAGNTNQGTSAIAIGPIAGRDDQGIQAIAIGVSAGQTSQGIDSIAIGGSAGSTSQSGGAVAVGSSAGSNLQGSNAVAVGLNAGNDTQGNDAVSIGSSAGNLTQGANAVAVGVLAGNDTQGLGAVAVGGGAGRNIQGETAVAIGADAGYQNQGIDAVAVGDAAGNQFQGVNAVAVGYSAGSNTQGVSAIAIGAYAGDTNQPANSIVINASGSSLNGANTGTYIAPIRTDDSVDATQWTIYYNAQTNEITTATRFNGGTIANALKITNTTESAATNSGALIVEGGVGVGGNVNVGGNIFVQGVINATVVGSISTATNITGGSAGALVYQTGFGQTSFINAGTAGTILVSQGATSPAYQNTLTLAGTTQAISTTTGAFQVRGGVGIGKDLWVGGDIYTLGQMVITTATVNNYANQTFLFAGADISVSTSSGNITVSNTSTLQSVTSRGATTNNAITITTATQSTGTNTGALVVTGGAGFGKDVWIGGNLNVDGDIFLQGVGLNSINGTTATFDNVFVTGAGTGISVTNNATVGGNLTATTLNVIGQSTLQNVRSEITTSTILIADSAILSSTYVSSNLGVQGNFNTTGTTTLIGAVYADSNVGVKGNLAVTGTSVLSGVTASSLGVSGNVNVTGTTVLSTLTITNTLNVGSTTTFIKSIIVGPASQYKSYESITTSTTDVLIIDTFDSTFYRTVKYLVQVVDTGYTPNRVQVEEFLVFHDNNGASTLVDIIQYAVGNNTGALGEFDAIYNAGEIAIQFTPAFAPVSLTAKTVRTAVTV